jgi:hypothetical protein
MQFEFMDAISFVMYGIMSEESEFAPFNKIEKHQIPSMDAMQYDMENRVVNEVLVRMASPAVTNVVPNIVDHYSDEVIQLTVGILKKMFKSVLAGCEDRLRVYVDRFRSTGRVSYVASYQGSLVPDPLKISAVMLLNEPNRLGGNVGLPKEPEMLEREEVLISIYDAIPPTPFIGASPDRSNFVTFLAAPDPDDAILDMRDLITASYARGANRAPALRHQTEFDEETLRHMAKNINELVLANVDVFGGAPLHSPDVRANANDPFAVARRYEWIRITVPHKTIVPVELTRMPDDTNILTSAVTVGIDYKDGTSNLKLLLPKITQYYRCVLNQNEASLSFNLYTAPRTNHLNKVLLDIDGAAQDGVSDPYSGTLDYSTRDGAFVVENNHSVARRAMEKTTGGLELLNAYVGS